MIDLMRTYPNVDSHTSGCAQLLAAVIADAIKCASTPPSKEELEYKTSVNRQSCDAARSIWFLFDDKSLFTLYAKLIGMDAEAIRDALLSTSKTYKHKGEFTWAQSRIIRLRYAWYIQLKNSTPKYKHKMLQMPERDPPEQPPLPRSHQKKQIPEYLTTRDVWQYASQQGETNDDSNTTDTVSGKRSNGS